MHFSGAEPDTLALTFTQPWATVTAGCLAVVVALIALVGVLLTRRQAAEHFERTHVLEQVQALRERYTKAAEQLGHDSTAVRFAGVYALAALADDWYETYGDEHLREVQVCIDVLCAYMRADRGHSPEDQSVRSAVWSVIRNHRPQRGSEFQKLVPDPPEPGFRRFQRNIGGSTVSPDWSWAPLDLAGANLTDVNLSFMDLSNANLSGADLSSCSLDHTELYGAVLVGANLTGAELHRTQLQDANLEAANLSNARLIKANLHRANLEKANAQGAQIGESVLAEANLFRANFADALISWTNMDNTEVWGTVFTGATVGLDRDQYDKLENPQLAIDLQAPSDRSGQVAP